MKINVNFRDGVAAGLCGSCDHALIMIDDQDHQRVECSWSHPSITIHRPLKHCSDYDAKGKQSRHDMERIAWVLEFRKGQPIGFRPPKPKSDD